MEMSFQLKTIRQTIQSLIDCTVYSFVFTMQLLRLLTFVQLIDLVLFTFFVSNTAVKIYLWDQKIDPFSD